MDALLTRRLDRFRASSRPTNSVGAERAPPDHAAALAAALGATVTNGVVSVVSSIPLPLDRLAVARQLWKHRLGGARLGLVESGVCGIERDDDLPGYLIPEHYFTYLRTRDAGLLSAVVEHNCEDIISMARLLAVLATDVASPA